MSMGRPSRAIGFVLVTLLALGNAAIAHEDQWISQGNQSPHHRSMAPSESIDEFLDQILYEWAQANLSGTDHLAKILLRKREMMSSNLENGCAHQDNRSTCEQGAGLPSAVTWDLVLGRMSEAIPYAECVVRHWGESHAIEADRRASTALENVEQELSTLPQRNFYDAEAASYVKEAMIHVRAAINDGKHGRANRATAHAGTALDFAEAAAMMSQCRGRACGSSTADAGGEGDGNGGLLTTGTESLPKIFEKAQCIVCHTVPGISGAAEGEFGPELYMKANAPKRISDPGYHGAATSVREYIMESIIDPNLYVVPGFDKDLMPHDFGTTLNAKTVFRIVNYLSQLEQRKVP